MTMKTTLIAASTALVIAGTRLTAPTAATASPFAAFKTTEIQTEATGVEEVGRRWRRRGRANAGAVAAGAIIGLAAGAIIASGAAQARPRCRTVRVERWSNRHQAYVIRKRRVCN